MPSSTINPQDLGTKLREIASKFQLDGKVVTISPLGEGFINETFIVRTEGDSPNYILQQKNHHIFPNIEGMMNNILQVTSHIRGKVSDSVRECMTIKLTHKDNLPYYIDEAGNYWAVCLFIPNTITYTEAKTPLLAYQGGLGIGRFQTQLADFSTPLVETIKGFHNIRWRFTQWDKALVANSAKRIDLVREEIKWIEDRRKEMLQFWELVETGVLPLRVTHNDTKISNILFDETTKDVLCVIDLDTVMSSTSLNDFGDAIRSYANTSSEDERNLSNVSINLELYEAYAKGYLSQRMDSLTKNEIDYLAFSAKYITFEQTLRFLMDYIDGDTYYKTKSPDHNLVRSHAQYKLLQSMEEQFSEMRQIIRRI